MRGPGVSTVEFLLGRDSSCRVGIGIPGVTLQAATDTCPQDDMHMLLWTLVQLSREL